MDFENLFRDAIGYTRDTFIGHWVRWLIFVLLGLPFALVRFVIDPAKIITGTTVHWELIPWGTLAGLVLAGVLASFFVSGYLVRMYRGVKPAPDFTGWVSLFIDGVKLDIVMFVWFLPALILFLLLAAIALGGFLIPGLFGGAGNTLAFLLAAVVLLIAALVLLVIAALYVSMAAVRFARTGSMTEGWSLSVISGIIRRIGWGNYIIALILLFVAGAIFGVVVSIPAAIPYIGWVVPLVLSPLLTVFSGRYIALVYEAGEESPATPAEAPGA